MSALREGLIFVQRDTHASGSCSCVLTAIRSKSATPPFEDGTCLWLAGPRHHRSRHHHHHTGPDGPPVRLLSVEITTDSSSDDDDEHEGDAPVYPQFLADPVLDPASMSSSDDGSDGEEGPSRHHLIHPLIHMETEDSSGMETDTSSEHGPHPGHGAPPQDTASSMAATNGHHTTPPAESAPAPATFPDGAPSLSSGRADSRPVVPQSASGARISSAQQPQQAATSLPAQPDWYAELGIPPGGWKGVPLENAGNPAGAAASTAQGRTPSPAVSDRKRSPTAAGLATHPPGDAAKVLRGTSAAGLGARPSSAGRSGDMQPNGAAGPSGGLAGGVDMGGSQTEKVLAGKDASRLAALVTLNQPTDAGAHAVTLTLLPHTPPPPPPGGPPLSFLSLRAGLI